MDSKYSLTGKNIVIGIGDTGLDSSHCLFRDSVAMKYNTIISGHRKIQAYDTTYGDKSDQEYKYKEVFE